MEKITDKMLLDKAIAFCDELLSENGVKKYISNITENHLQYPLDEVVKRKYVMKVLIKVRKNYLMK